MLVCLPTVVLRKRMWVVISHLAALHLLDKPLFIHFVNTVLWKASDLCRQGLTSPIKMFCWCHTLNTLCCFMHPRRRAPDCRRCDGVETQRGCSWWEHTHWWEVKPLRGAGGALHTRQVEFRGKGHHGDSKPAFKVVKHLSVWIQEHCFWKRCIYIFCHRRRWSAQSWQRLHCSCFSSLHLTRAWQSLYVSMLMSSIALNI